MSLLLALAALLPQDGSEYRAQANCVHEMMVDNGSLGTGTARDICKFRHHWNDDEAEAAVEVAVARDALDEATDMAVRSGLSEATLRDVFATLSPAQIARFGKSPGSRAPADMLALLLERFRAKGVTNDVQLRAAADASVAHAVVENAVLAFIELRRQRG